MIAIHEKFWSNDWFIGLAIGIILLLIATFNGLQPLEYKGYEWAINLIHRQPSDNVVVIAIDENSMSKLWEWPWWRSIYGQLVDLVAPQSKVMGITLDFSQVQSPLKPKVINSGVTNFSLSKAPEPLYWLEDLAELKELLEKVSKMGRGSSSEKKYLKPILEFYRSSPMFSKFPESFTLLKQEILSLEENLSGDLKLANSFQQVGNVMLGMKLSLTNDGVKSSLPSYVLKYGLTPVNAQSVPYFGASSVVTTPQGIPPLALFGNRVSGIGYVTLQPNLDARYLPLVTKYQEDYLPSLSLLLVAKSLSIPLDEIKVQLGHQVKMGELTIATDNLTQIQPWFYDNSIRVDSFAKVLTGEIPLETYRDKIVLLGVTAPPYATMQHTPRGEMPAVLVLAHQISSLLNGDYLVYSYWLLGIEVGLFSLILVYVCWWLPRLKSLAAWGWSLTLCLGLGTIYGVFLNYGWAMQHLMPTLLLLPTTQIALFIKRGVVAYQDAFRSHPDAVESNRLLGLAFQGQGLLDMAFEKFRLCPPDESIMGLLYNLALDYELKRQFRRAGAVYRYLQSHQPVFRDVEQRMERLQMLKKPRLRHSKLMTLGDCWFDEEGDKPILGRYQIERPLGKGAMGVVYLGRDSKLDRLVAIKTLSLLHEFEEPELEEATIRFFREATAAGRLKHPNIVTIYDAGEEQDLAYICMEFFKGGNLIAYTKADNLLPITTVIKIIIAAAESLDYAFKQGVVHRDIKPANIMYNPATEQIKITDFGIACITDTHKTKTSIILGTPSYMSPEQLAGKQVDGRSDLFSLGVMLYQLLTGVLPFQAESMTTLMFKIANESHHDINLVRANLPYSLKQVVDTALQKNMMNRFQTGIQFAQALRDCQIFGEV